MSLPAAQISVSVVPNKSKPQTTNITLCFFAEPERQCESTRIVRETHNQISACVSVPFIAQTVPEALAALALLALAITSFVSGVHRYYELYQPCTPGSFSTRPISEKTASRNCKDFICEPGGKGKHREFACFVHLLRAHRSGLKKKEQGFKIALHPTSRHRRLRAFDTCPSGEAPAGRQNNHQKEEKLFKSHLLPFSHRENTRQLVDSPAAAEARIHYP